MVRTPESPDILHARTTDMRPAVLKYAENIQRQRVELIKELGFGSLDELQSAIAADIRHFAQSPYREKIATLTELSAIVRAILENPKEYELLIEEEFPEKEAELRELFGKEYVVGFQEIEKAFMLQDGTKALEISEQERQEAMEQLIDKLDEPDIIEFMKHLESDPTEAAKWMLVYRTSAQINDTQPVSILGLRDILDADARRGTSGEELVHRDNADDQGWYREDKVATEPDVWASRQVKSGWMFVTRTVVEGTTSKKHADQTPVLKKKAKALGLEESECRRRTPQEVLYDTLVIYRAHGIRLLEDKYDWTEQKTSGRMVRVGGFGADGVGVLYRDPDDDNVWDGACLSR